MVDREPSRNNADLTAPSIEMDAAEAERLLALDLESAEASFVDDGFSIPDLSADLNALGDNSDPVSDPFAGLPAFDSDLTVDSGSKPAAASAQAAPAGSSGGVLAAATTTAVASAASASASTAAATVSTSAKAAANPAANPASPQSHPAQESDSPRNALWRERLLMRSVPSWMVSMILHVGILMTLAAIQIEPVRDAIGILMTATAGDESGGIEENFDIQGPDLEMPAAAASADEAFASPSDFSSSEIALPDSSTLTAAFEAKIDMGNIGSKVESILPSSALSSSAGRMSSSLSGRSSGARKGELLERYGGNAASEKSVAAALKWIAEHQDRSGGWTFGHSSVCRGQCKDDGDIPQATNAATALALLPFLGAGQTHLEGSYKTTVHNGLKFLINRMKVTRSATPYGSWHEPGGSMYSHGLASIVMCEAYAMTRDPDLLQPAQLALNFIVYAQDPRGGGWRYNPKQAGDTSVVGWQLMAMKSGAMGNLVVPPESFRLANNFLDAMSVNDGAFYGYDQPTSKVEGRQSTTAVGLLCRMYLGWPKDKQGIKDGVAFLSKRGPSVDDLYYSYYATQVLRQYGGEEWKKWNTVMRDSLIKAQSTEVTLPAVGSRAKDITPKAADSTAPPCPP